MLTAERTSHAGVRAVGGDWRQSKGTWSGLEGQKETGRGGARGTQARQ